MASRTLGAGTFYAQKEFPQQTELRIRAQYKIAAEEKLILALWKGAASHKGFIITDHALRWNLGSQEKAAQATLTVNAEETFPKLIIHSEELEEDAVLILQKMTAPQAQNLCDAITEAMTGKADFEALSPAIKPAPLAKERNILDAAGLFFGSLFSPAAKQKHRKHGETQREEEKPESSGQKQEKAFTARAVILSIIDVIASLTFIAAIVIALKPWLLQNNPSASRADSLSAFLDALENLFLRRGIMHDLPQELRNLRNIVVFSLMASYFALKLIVLGASKNGPFKVVSVLLVALMFLCFALLMDKFLIFLMFALVIYFSFELSCRFTAKGTLVKLIVICAVSVVAYFIIHCILVEDIQEAFLQIFRELSLPVQRWL